MNHKHRHERILKWEKSTMYVPDDYADRVRTVRWRLGLTQTQFAKRLGVAFVSVNRWENSKHRPTRVVWTKIKRLEARK
jgi:ribosome-binding protein aMBF1 (putative translation factor)